MFFACAVGIFLGTVARSMPQLGLLYMLVYLPMNALSGSNTRLESVPPWLAKAMQSLRSTYFVSFAQSILYRASASTNHAGQRSVCAARAAPTERRNT